MGGLANAGKAKKGGKSSAAQGSGRGVQGLNDGSGDRGGLQKAVKFDSNTCDLRGMRVSALLST